MDGSSAWTTIGFAAWALHGAGTVAVCDEAHLQQALSGGGVVEFACAGTIPITQTILISQDTTLNGNFFGVTLDGRSQRQIISIANGTTLTINALTLANGKAAPNGGAIASAGNLNLNDCQFTGNQAAASGGAVHQSGGGTVAIRNSTFGGNSVLPTVGQPAHAGGALAVNAGSLTVTASRFTGNQATGEPETQGNGGALWLNGVATSIATSTFDNNLAKGGFVYSRFELSQVRGGAIFFTNGSLSVSNSTFYSNLASGGDATAKDSHTGAGFGGAIANVGSSAGVLASISASSFFNNQATCGANLNGLTCPGVTPYFPDALTLLGNSALDYTLISRSFSTIIH